MHLQLNINPWDKLKVEDDEDVGQLDDVINDVTTYDDKQWKELIANRRKKEQLLRSNDDAGKNLSIINNQLVFDDISSKYKYPMVVARPDEMAYSLYLKKQQQKQKLLRKEDKLQKLETVTTVPKLQQPFDKLSNLENAVILEEALASANTVVMGTATTYTATTSATIVPTSTVIATTLVKTTATTSLSSSSLLHLSETALAKFNRIIDSTMSATNIYSCPRAMEDLAYLRHRTTARSTILEQCLTDVCTSNSSKMNNTNSNTGTSATSSFTGFMEPELDTDLDDRYAMKRNDVHYLLKQFNSFSDIEEIEITGSKAEEKQQKQAEQAQRQEQLIQQQEHYHQGYNQHEQYQQQKHQQQYLNESLERQKWQTVEDQEVTKKLEQEETDVLTGDNKEEVHSMEAMYMSPTATSLVLYSPSSQSHKGIRRYASLHQSKEFSHQEHHHVQHQHSCYQFHQHQYPPPYPNIPHEHSADACIGKIKVADPRTLQQFIDDYIFESCHYLEAEHFTANYRTAMVESSSHEFRPSTTTTATQSMKGESGEDIDNDECKVNGIGRKYGDVEDDNLSISSSARSFELHETEPPSVICKAPAPTQAPVSASTLTSAPTRSGFQTMETRLCSSGVQTDLTASSLGDYYVGSMKISPSLSSSTPSSERRARRKPLFKCCYTPLDRWREKRARGAATRTNKTEMEKTIELAHPLQQPYSTKTTTILAAGNSGSGTRTLLTGSCGTVYGSHAV